jgi:hypothetical protein
MSTYLPVSTFPLAHLTLKPGNISSYVGCEGRVPLGRVEHDLRLRITGRFLPGVSPSSALSQLHGISTNRAEDPGGRSGIEHEACALGIRRKIAVSGLPRRGYSGGR